MSIDFGSYSDELLQVILTSIKEEIQNRKALRRFKGRAIFARALNPLDFAKETSFNKAVHARNSSGFYSLPFQEGTCAGRARYLQSLIAQDWSSLFASYSREPSNFYVYAHVDPSEHIFVADKLSGGNYCGNPFYIGKGKGQRAWDLKRNQGHGKKIKTVLEKGFDKSDIVKIVFDNLSEAKAMEFEAKLIYFFGTKYEREKGSSLYNLDLSVRPIFIGEMQKLTKSAAKGAKTNFYKSHAKASSEKADV